MTVCNSLRLEMAISLFYFIGGILGAKTFGGKQMKESGFLPCAERPY